MITFLSINNFALIEKLAIDFSGGFSIITGETGAGKSILLGALGLVMGKRADLSSLKNKDEKCVIEAHFKISGYHLQSFFEENGLDYEDDTIIRREILPTGKSRAFINDTPANLQELQDLSEFLIDIHSQHQTQELSEDQFQFQVIDAIASNKNSLTKYAEILKSYKKDKEQIAVLKEQLISFLKEQDYNAFLLDELVSANLRAGEQAELEADFEQLNNVEFIKEQLDKSIAIADGNELGLLPKINEIRASMHKIAVFSTVYQSLSERINSVAIELSDITSEISKCSENLSQDPEQLEFINQKLQQLYSLQKKHHVASVEELIAIQSELQQKVNSVTNLENEIVELEVKLAVSKAALESQSVIIHQNRIDAIPILTAKWVAILHELGMPNVRFEINLKTVDHFLVNGKDELQFLFSANKGSDFGLLKKVASGGEMSRIMLATKAILAQYSSLPTIIFDEIDTGVSGEIANKMGEIMKEMSGQMQVFAITHLPQIAAKGTTHFKVFKSISNNATRTELKSLLHEERILEIAQMLSGTAVSDSALNHAKALLE